VVHVRAERLLSAALCTILSVVPPSVLTPEESPVQLVAVSFLLSLCILVNPVSSHFEIGKQGLNLAVSRQVPFSFPWSSVERDVTGKGSDVAPPPSDPMGHLGSGPAT